VAADTLAIFFQEVFPVIRSKCARMLGDEAVAAEIAQETFLRLWAEGVAEAPAAAKMRWVYRTSTRLAIDHLRRRRLGVEVPAREDHDAPAATARADDVAQARQSLARLGRELSPRELEVLILARCDRMSHEEVAEVTDLSSRSVRRILARIDERLTLLERSPA
jgi:RNA polymerase sigma-70 factor (ECF subfamily)